MKFPGSLACVGLGVLFEAHLTPGTRRCIEDSDVIFVAHMDAGASIALNRLHGDVRSLFSEAGSHGDARPLNDATIEIVLTEMRSGKRVCVSFFGHPSSGLRNAHMLVRAAHQEGFHAQIEPAISIEDCIYADLRIDPGKYGCQQYDVSQIMLYRRSIDTSAYLILWRFGSEEMRPEPRRKLLLDVLAREYPLDHKVFAYVPPSMEAASTFTKWVIGSLATVQTVPLTVLVIPPAADLLPDKEIRARLAQLNERASFGS